jgi:hypothetical protein
MWYVYSSLLLQAFSVVAETSGSGPIFVGLYDDGGLFPRPQLQSPLLPPPSSLLPPPSSLLPPPSSLTSSGLFSSDFYLAHLDSTNPYQDPVFIGNVKSSFEVGNNYATAYHQESDTYFFTGGGGDDAIWNFWTVRIFFLPSCYFLLPPSSSSFLLSPSLSIPV